MKKEKPEIDRTICHLTSWSGFPDSTVLRNNYIFSEEENEAVKTTSSTRNYWENNRYTGELNHPGKGFENFAGKFDRKLWYEKSDSNWNTLVDFVKDRMVTLNGRQVRVLDVIGYY
jgi:hypothetical protein